MLAPATRVCAFGSIIASLPFTSFSSDDVVRERNEVAVILLIR